MTYRGMKFTEREVAEMFLKRGEPVQAPPPKPSKMHNIFETCDGIKFQSKREAKYYRELLCRVHAGEVKYFLRQVPFDLFGVKYRVDFMEVLKDGSIRYVDVKGFRTSGYINKRKQVMNLYPVRIEEA